MRGGFNPYKKLKSRKRSLKKINKGGGKSKKFRKTRKLSKRF